MLTQKEKEKKRKEEGRLEIINAKSAYKEQARLRDHVEPEKEEE